MRAGETYLRVILRLPTAQVAETRTGRAVRYGWKTRQIGGRELITRPKKFERQSSRIVHDNVVRRRSGSFTAISTTSASLGRTHPAPPAGQEVPYGAPSPPSPPRTWRFQRLAFH